MREKEKILEMMTSVARQHVKSDELARALAEQKFNSLTREQRREWKKAIKGMKQVERKYGIKHVQRKLTRLDELYGRR